MPEDRANLFSVKPAARNGLEIVNGQGSAVKLKSNIKLSLAAGRLENNLCTMNFKRFKSGQVQ